MAGCRVCDSDACSPMCTWCQEPLCIMWGLVWFIPTQWLMLDKPRGRARTFKPSSYFYPVITFETTASTHGVLQPCANITAVSYCVCCDRAHVLLLARRATSSEAGGRLLCCQRWTRS